MLIIISLLISTGCLAAGYILFGYWLIFLVFPLMLIAWLLTYKRSIYLAASILLSGYVTLAAIGITLDLSPVLMIIAPTTALVSWDLLQFDQGSSGNLFYKSNLLREKHHLSSLALATSTGLILALLSANINLHIPFVVVVFLVLLTMGCLMYGAQFVVKKNH